MSRMAYHKELSSLEKDLVDMAAMVRDAIQKSVRSLERRDIVMSREVVEGDKLINDRRYEIEERCLLLIATQQPMAVDLRTIAAMLNIITDLERMADHAEGTANITIKLGESPLVKPLEDIPVMARIAIEMLDSCIKAFEERDADAARKVCDKDDEVDALYDRVYRRLIDTMIADPETIEGATYLMWVAHNLERVADRVTNIAERVVFMATGKLEEMNVSTY